MGQEPKLTFEAGLHNSNDVEGSLVETRADPALVPLVYSAARVVPSMPSLLRGQASAQSFNRGGWMSLLVPRSCNECVCLVRSASNQATNRGTRCRK